MNLKIDSPGKISAFEDSLTHYCVYVYLYFGSLGVHSIGKSGFRFSKSKSGFPDRTQNPKTDFTYEKSVLRVDFNKEIQNRIFWISLLPFDWEIRKRICKTILVNSGLLFTNYACACKTAVRKDSFSNPFFGFPIRTVKRKVQKKKILALKYVFGFCVRLQIRNPDFKI